MIWGVAFTAQSVCSNYLPPFSISAFRSLLAAAVLIVFRLISRKSIGQWRDVILGGLFCGIPLFLATNLQQFGIGETSAGKAGFITALYIVLVPMLGIGLKKKVSLTVWISVMIAVVGMYFLCVTDGFSIAVGDLSLLACALMFAIQIIAIDHYAEKVDGITLSAAQFLVTGICSVLCAVCFETPTVSGFQNCILPLLYIALFSSCIAYTLQIIAQKGGNPTVVSLLLSMESVFAALSGALLLHERLSSREGMGCLLMVAAIVLAQLPERNKAKKA